MSVTKADLQAAREGIHKIAEGPGLINKLIHGTEGATQLESIQTTQTWVEEIRKKYGTNPTEEQLSKFFDEHAKGMITGHMKKINEGGYTTKQEVTSGGLGLGIGSLLGAAFGGAKGAAIGGLLGSLAMWAMEKFDLTPEFLQPVMKDATKVWAGDDEAKAEEAAKSAVETFRTKTVPPAETEKGSKAQAAAGVTTGAAAATLTAAGLDKKTETATSMEKATADTTPTTSAPPTTDAAVKGPKQSGDMVDETLADMDDADEYLDMNYTATDEKLAAVNKYRAESGEAPLTMEQYQANLARDKAGATGSAEKPMRNVVGDNTFDDTPPAPAQPPKATVNAPADPGEVAARRAAARSSNAAAQTGAGKLRNAIAEKATYAREYAGVPGEFVRGVYGGYKDTGDATKGLVKDVTGAVSANIGAAGSQAEAAGKKVLAQGKNVAAEAQNRFNKFSKSTTDWLNRRKNEGKTILEGFKGN